MAELEIHTEPESQADPRGQRVGILAAVLAVALAIATIASHRAHTAGVILRTEANDHWAFYQSQRIKLHNAELGEELISALGSKNEGTDHALERFRSEKAHYEGESNIAREEARKKVKEGDAVEERALRYDFGEGLLEIALVLTSLYFISRKMLFPIIGVIAGVAGLVIAFTSAVS
ncbi:MAG: DUF4337 domain-containing protein [Acidobacteriia bacterium]|nr:DUF4337 domain-containing protein [Terriglobia bacterium]